ncbi:uncharacterized protein LOC127514149 [Ctenopharyngodon idella]|uniref:uncharacterized protein LOC127514149 n=1 Tax=Ctenopharyngodon idella TaxID=7959 RepID=UPI0022302D3E|nr:uncharacterized protein LOC127514149 [Ctenopharyngodon idella]
MLSQQQGNPAKLHPCAAFSRKLSPAERNYDIGNRELLAIKLVLEEWRHWLEGAQHPFTVLTDHKNLEYLRDAKRLNQRQAHWALFFTRFHFSISDRPGPKNVKADALSCLYTPEESNEVPEPILPENIIVSPIKWSETTIPSSNASTNTLPGCPIGLQYINRIQCTPLIHSSHTLLGTGHPGANETLSLLKERFWWPNMARDVRRYVQGCQECAISKSPHHLPSGKLHPLPVPNRPWSHLGVDFITDLPASNNCTCILVVINRFSNTLKGSAHCNGDCRTHVQPHLQILRNSRGHCIRPWTPIHIQGVEGILRSSRCDRKPLLRLPSSVERADVEEDPGDRTIPPFFLPWPPGLSEPVSGLGRVHTELPASTHHWTRSLPVRALLPTPTLPLVRGTIGCTSCRLLVPREQEGLGRSPPSATTSLAQTQDDSRPETFPHTSLSTRTEGLAVNPGHQNVSALQEAQSQIHWPLHHLEADQPGHLSAQVTCTIQNSPYLPCLTSQASPPFCFHFHKAWRSSWKPPPPPPLILEDGAAYQVNEILDS